MVDFFEIHVVILWFGNVYAISIQSEYNAMLEPEGSSKIGEVTLMRPIHGNL